MPIPALTLLPGGFNLWAQGTGDPVNGANIIPLPFVANGTPPDKITDDNLDIKIVRLGPSVTAASLGVPLLNPAKTAMTLNFTQTGADQVQILVQLIHSLIQ